MHGYIVHIYPDGSSEEGNYILTSRHGTFIATYPNGIKYELFYQYGELLTEEDS